MSNTAMLDDNVLEDAVTRASVTVPREHYVEHPRLGRVPQATAQVAIERDLRRVGVAAGQRVLEIGTGSGLTGALLVGPDGHVVSVDIDEALTRRAEALHAERGVGNLTLVTRDGHLGAAEHGRYDAVVAWCTPTHIPQAWVDQAAGDGVISTPIYLAEVARTVGHVCVRVTDTGELTGARLGRASYVDMGDEVNTELGIPMFLSRCAGPDRRRRSRVDQRRLAWPLRRP